MVADALSRKASCHCLTVKASDTTLCQEMEKLNLEMIQHGTLNQLKLESILLQKIINAQRSDKGMRHIHEKIEADKTNCFRKDDQGISWFNNRIVVPKMRKSASKFWMKLILVDIPFTPEALRCIKI
jgi:hypothetical protein